MRVESQAWLRFCIAYAIAMAGCTVLPAAVLLGSTASMAEPFLTWADYFMCGATMTVVGAIILAIPFALFTAALLMIRNRPHRRAVVGCLQWVWVATPAVLTWCAGVMLEATYNPGFNGPINSGPPPASWRPTLAIRSHPAVLWAGAGIALLLVVRGYAPQVRKWRKLDAAAAAAGKVCVHCGYSVAGLTTPVCPECGHEHTARDGERAVLEGIGPAIPGDQ